MRNPSGLHLQVNDFWCGSCRFYTVQVTNVQFFICLKCLPVQSKQLNSYRGLISNLGLEPRTDAVDAEDRHSNTEAENPSKETLEA
jgi:hypothetical protein